MYTHHCEHCNEQLEAYEVMAPSYDDGGSLDAIEVYTHVEDCDCAGAVKARQRVQPMRSPQQPPYETDDLPF